MRTWVVYLTLYRGNKLPPFYIGSSWLGRIQQKNYHGSVSSLEYRDAWKNELKEHPELFETRAVVICKTESEARRREKELQLKLKVLKNPLYLNRSVGNDHFVMSKYRVYDGSWNKGMKLSKEHRAHLRENHKGMTGRKHRPESNAKRRASLKNVPRVVCQHCKLSYQPANYSRWHGDKCKFQTST